MSEYVMPKNPNLGYGNMRMPRFADGSVNMDLVLKMVDAYMSHGFNYFDTAFTYKDAEEVLHEAVVKRYPRDRYMITTKLSLADCATPEDMEKQFAISRERLGLDYVDTYFIHGLGPKTYDKCDAFKAFDFLREMKAKGYTKHIGFSFHGNAEKLEELLTANPDMELVQLQLNYLDWEDEKVQSRLCYETARRHNIPISVIEPCKGGWLTSIDSEAGRILLEANPDAHPASWAFRFIAGLEGIYVILSGMGNVEQVEDNCRTFENFTPLTEEERAVTLKVVDKIHSIPTVPCTDCKYCTKGCPKDLPIPFFMRSYNTLLLYNETASSKNIYEMMSRGTFKASDCIGCHSCEQRCPQGIEITKYIEVLKEKYDT